MSKENAPGDGIRRRDFLNGVLLGAGAALVNGFFPLRALAGGTPSPAAPPWPCDGSIGSDARALRGGNLPQTFNIAHWMRDDRLTFARHSVTIAPGRCDPYEGRFPIAEDGGRYDVVICGSGISGLSAALYILNRRPGTKVLILDAQTVMGGNAGRDDIGLPGSPGRTVPAATAGAYAVAPYADFQNEIYDGIGLDWTRYQIPDPFYSYFFDQNTPYAKPGARGWTIDTYGAGAASMPYPKAILADILAAQADFSNWYNVAGAPTDPADNSDPRFDYLAQITLDDYITKVKGWHPAVSDFYTRYAIDALAGTSKQVNAYNSISFLGAEYNPCWAPPGGTSGLARLMLKKLIPGAIAGSTADAALAHPINPDALDRSGQAVRIRERSMVVRADTGANGAEVIYFQDGNFHRASAKAVILAGQSHTGQNITKHLLDANRQSAWDQFVQGPVVVANVVLHRAKPLVDLGLGYDQYWWGSKYWADFTVADWTTGHRADPNREVVLTFYGGNTAPAEEMANERVKLLVTPFDAYEDSLESDMNRIFASTGFDFDRDVKSVYVYRWGHSMIFPTPGFPFGAPGTDASGGAVRNPAPRHIARAQLGRISFAGQDTESSPAVESALGSGLRTALEVLPLL